MNSDIPVLLMEGTTLVFISESKLAAGSECAPRATLYGPNPSRSPALNSVFACHAPARWVEAFSVTRMTLSPARPGMKRYAGNELGAPAELWTSSAAAPDLSGKNPSHFGTDAKSVAHFLKGTFRDYCVFL